MMLLPPPLLLLPLLTCTLASPRSRMDADLNSYMDRMIAYLQTYLNSHGMNPYPMPNITRSINLLLLVGELDLYNGQLHHLDSIHSKNASMDYQDETAIISADLGFGELTYEYPFKATVDWVPVNGQAHGVVTDLNVHVELAADLTNLTDVHVTLRDLVITHTGTLTVLLDVTGSVLDILADAISSVVTATFKDVIMAEVQKEAKVAVQKAIQEIDFNVGGSRRIRGLTPASSSARA